MPDFGGKKVVVVTENAYPPLQFIDPKTGKQIGWEYDAMAKWPSGSISLSSTRTRRGTR